MSDDQSATELLDDIYLVGRIVRSMLSNLGRHFGDRTARLGLAAGIAELYRDQPGGVDLFIEALRDGPPLAHFKSGDPS